MADREAAYRPFIEGERIFLRAVLASDVTERYARWMNDPEVSRFLESRFRPSSPETIAAYVRKMEEAPDFLFLAIVLKEGGLHIGNIKAGPIDWVHRFAEVSLLIGEKDCWGKGLGTEAIRLIVRFAFETLNLHKLTACAYADNHGSIKAFQKAGFLEEGLRKEQRFFAGMYTDEALFGIVRNDGAATKRG
jgi:[ribosomal protein S5]-alanine N-acetyltransferase